MDSTLLAILMAKAKLTLRITTNVFDSEIEDILRAGYLDLTTRGVIITQNDTTGEISPMVVRALMTYVRYHFGEPENPEKLKASYDEQKGQLMTTTGYTNWGDA